MRLTVALFFGCAVLLGCQRGDRYILVQRSLVQTKLFTQNQFQELNGYDVVVRNTEDNPGYYIVAHGNPLLLIFPRYQGQGKIELTKLDSIVLRDTLSKFYGKTYEDEQTKMIQTIGEMITLLKSNSLYGLSGFRTSDSTYIVDFYLSRQEILRFFSKGSLLEFPPGRQTKKLADNWWYLTANSENSPRC